jgi:hypothetical protein
MFTIRRCDVSYGVRKSLWFTPAMPVRRDFYDMTGSRLNVCIGRNADRLILNPKLGGQTDSPQW